MVKKGIFDEAGRELLPIKYQRIDKSYKGFARVKSEGRWYHIDKNGNEIK